MQSQQQNETRQHTKMVRKVWFPEDEDGDFHPLNPDNGCGGGVYKLEIIHPIYYTSDGLSPRDDMSNVLEGREAKSMGKIEVLGGNWLETSDLVYRMFYFPIEEGGCNGQWEILEQKLLEMEEPQWSLIGQLWSSLNPNSPRIEEQMNVVMSYA